MESTKLELPKSGRFADLAKIVPIDSFFVPTLFDYRTIDFNFDDAFSFTENLAKVKLNNKWGFIDKTGKTIIPFEYEQAISFQNGKARVKKNGKWFWIDKTGKCVKDCE